MMEDSGLAGGQEGAGVSQGWDAWSQRWDFKGLDPALGMSRPYQSCGS